MKKYYLKSILVALLLIAATSGNAQSAYSTHFRVCPDGSCLDYLPQWARINLDEIPRIERIPNDKEFESYKKQKQVFEKKTSSEAVYLDNQVAWLAMDVNLGMSDGVWTKKGVTRIWSICISVPNAEQIAVQIVNHSFAPNSQMYVYSLDGKEIRGPFIAEFFNIRKKRDIWAAYLEKSGTMVIQIIEPANSEQTSTFEIKSISVIPKAQAETASLSCHKDVVCFEDWQDEANGVCKIYFRISATKELTASGSLLNNTKQDNTPYILTAFHVVDDDKNNILSNAEKDDLDSYWFTFFNKKKECYGTEIFEGETFYGAKFRAAWRPTDFALLELNYGKVTDLYYQNLRFLGWDRETTAPDFGAIIHHPRGDIMKFSYDSTALNANLSSVTVKDSATNNTYTYAVGNLWAANLDVGAVEPGSSGSPLLNKYGYVVGQATSMVNRTEADCVFPYKFNSGRFDKSWTGGGNDSTRLRNWLDPKNTGVEWLNGKYPFNAASGIDLYVPDFNGDDGTQPSNNTQNLPNTSIKIYKEDGTTLAPYVEAKKKYIIKVTVKNKKSTPYTGGAMLEVRWAKKKIGSIWKKDWKGSMVMCSNGDFVPTSDLVDTIQIPNISANGEKTVSIIWQTPTDMICKYQYIERFGKNIPTMLAGGQYDIDLLARIVDGNTASDSITSISTDLFVKNYNNVAMNKTSYVFGKYAILMGAQPCDKYTLALAISKIKGKNLLDYAELYIIPTEKLFEHWQKHGIEGRGIKLTDKGVLITSPDAFISNIPLTSKEGEDEVFAVATYFFSNRTPEITDFSFDIKQIDKNGQETGSTNFVAVRNADRYFSIYANANAQLTEKSLKLSANEIGEPVKYTWYDQKGKKIGTERAIEIELPKTSQWYKLEVIAEADHYKDYDSVYVHIPLGYIVSLAPNPTKDDVIVEYFLSEIVKDATLKVYNSSGFLVAQEYLNIKDKEKFVSLSGLVKGTYSVVLLTNGSLADSKILIKQ